MGQLQHCSILSRNFRRFAPDFPNAGPPTGRLAEATRGFRAAQPGFGLILQSSRAMPMPPDRVEGRLFRP